MARGSGGHGHGHGHGHHGAPVIPKVQYEISKDDVFKLPAGVHDLQARGYGYNDFSEFRRPEIYIRHIDPLESDLATMVEYDMDEQDQEWLDMVNIDRKKEQIDKVTYEAFEIIMDRLEKEWFDLTKNIPKPDFAMPSEDSTCAICDDSEGENSNAIVFCDGCNLAVHQDCYGVPYIPEGQWLCRKCTVSPENPVSCMLCPNEGGAFKQTVHGDWVHLLCAIWIPETRVANDVFMEPITGADKISKQRLRLKCSVCSYKMGACIQCTKPTCFVAFHATCGRKEKLLMPMKSAQGAEPASLTCYCDKHLPEEQQEIRNAALEAEEEMLERMGHSSNLNTAKSARAYAKTYKPGPPLVPAIMVDRILKYIHRIKIRKKPEFIHQVCRYWSLKREARRGAPLLKRLHLEPWSVGGGVKSLSEEEKLMRLDQLRRLRQDLIFLKELTSQVRKRENLKLRQAREAYDVISKCLFPHHGALRMALEKIMMLDRHDDFKLPVSKAQVPDYFDVIKKPMCWDNIDAKLDHHEYWDLQSFLDDINLVLDNAMIYNQPGTPFHKTAMRIKKEARPLLNDLEKLRIEHVQPSQAPNGLVTGEEDGQDNASAAASNSNSGPNEDGSTPPPAVPPLGDLEPRLAEVELLFSASAIKDDLNIELESTPLAALFSYEFAKVKPPPPDNPESPVIQQLRSPVASGSGTALGPGGVQPLVLAPQPQRSHKSKKKSNHGTAKPRDRKAERARQKARAESRAAAAIAAAAIASGATNVDTAGIDPNDLQLALDSSAGFRAPRTRGAVATVVAASSSASTSAVPETPGANELEHRDYGDVHIPTFGHSASSTVEDPNTPGPSSVNTNNSNNNSAGKPLSKSKKRMPVAVPVGQPSVLPRVVSAVDNRDSFSMFNAGWILPPDQKRGGRAAHVAQSQSPAHGHGHGHAQSQNQNQGQVGVVLGPGQTHSIPIQYHTPTMATHNLGPDQASVMGMGMTPPPKKKQRIERLDSKLLSTVGTPGGISDNETYYKTPEPVPVPPAPVAGAPIPTPTSPFTDVHPSSSSTQPQANPNADDDVMDVDYTVQAQPQPQTYDYFSARHPDEFTSGPVDEADQDHGTADGNSTDNSLDLDMDDIDIPHNILKQPNGVVIIEKLDTPAIRREKGMRRKAEKQKLVDAGPSSLGGNDEMDESESELSELSEDSENPEQAAQKEHAGEELQAVSTKRLPSRKSTRVKRTPKTDPFVESTIVWAKSESFPWWPAVVYSESSDQVPVNILEAHKQKKQKRKMKLYIVQYYDKQSSWQSVPRDKLLLLGEDEKLDQELLGSGSKQKWKTSASRTHCREAYRRAQADMEVDGSGAGAADVTEGQNHADG